MIIVVVITALEFNKSLKVTSSTTVVRMMVAFQLHLGCVM